MLPKNPLHRIVGHCAWGRWTVRWESSRPASRYAGAVWLLMCRLEPFGGKCEDRKVGASTVVEASPQTSVWKTFKAKCQSCRAKQLLYHEKPGTQQLISVIRVSNHLGESAGPCWLAASGKDGGAVSDWRGLRKQDGQMLQDLGRINRWH